MQRATTADPASTPDVPAVEQGSRAPVADCPVCGEPVRGITAARPGEHRFVGCDHYASPRFLRGPAADVGAPSDRRPIGP